MPDTPPAAWPPPRGPRDPETGAWLWHLGSRPLADLAPAEARAVATYRTLAQDIGRARDDRRMSLRRVAAESGHALSVVTGLEQGSAWPRLRTMQDVADVVGLILRVAWVSGVEHELLRRQARRGSTSDVARAARLRRHTVADLARGGRSPSMSTVLALAVELDLPVELRVRPQ